MTPPDSPAALVNIDQTLIRAVEHVFRTMVKHPATLRETATSLDATRLGGGGQVMASVGFVGVSSGLIYLRMTEAFALLATGQVLSMTPLEIAAEGPDTVKDAMGELTNMLAGSFKNTLCDLGYPCKLTLPTIVRGLQVSVVAVRGATRQVFYFDCQNHPVIVDLQVKLE